MEDGEERVVFTGDTLFIGGTYLRTSNRSRSSVVETSPILMMDKGCGRFFEGTPAEMHTALNKTLAALPNDTKVYVSLSPTMLVMQQED